MTSKVRKALDKSVDALEKCSSPATRAGNSVERVSKLDACGVPRRAIAVLVTERTGEEWTEAEIGTLCKAYRQRHVLITASQATALLNDAALDREGNLAEDAMLLTRPLN
ncbi:MAG: hypothetical protein KA945_11285 [Zoogloea sp.]|jgi:hypothetical protein|nr:hypothetical protein [Zoogloea sp.]